MNKTLKIKLDKTSHLKEYEEELARWESEGGHSTELNEILDDLTLPLKPGDTIEVLDGSIISEDDEFYYRVEIKIQSPDINRID